MGTGEPEGQEAPQETRPASSPTLPTARRGTLVGLLVGLMLAELLLNRIGAQRLHLEWAGEVPRGWARALDLAGLFSFELVSVYAVLLLGAALVWLGIWGRELAPGARLTLPLLGGATVGLAALATLLRLPAPLLLQLRLNDLLLTLLMAMAGASAPRPGTARLGLLFVWLAGALSHLPVVVGKLPLGFELLPGTAEALPLVAMGLLAVGAGLLVPLEARRAAGARTQLVVTLLLGVALVGTLTVSPVEARRLLQFGLALDLPPAPLGPLGVAAALCTTVWAGLRLLSCHGTLRLRGLGLLIVLLCGSKLERAPELAAHAVGLLALTLSLLRSDEPALERDRFVALVQSLGALLGASAATVTGREGDETVRLHRSAQAGPPARVLLKRRLGRLAFVEVAHGDDDTVQPPALTLLRRTSRRLGPLPEEGALEVGDPEFDATFRTWVRREAGGHLLGDDLRPRLARLCRGWLGIWPRAGLLYRVEAPVGAPHELSELLVLLDELHRRAA